MVERKKTTTETPESLAELAKRFAAVATRLTKVSEGMLLKGVHDLVVMHGPGTNLAISQTVEPFAADAKKKAEAKGVKIREP